MTAFRRRRCGRHWGFTGRCPAIRRIGLLQRFAITLGSDGDHLQRHGLAGQGCSAGGQAYPALKNGRLSRSIK